MRNISLIEKYLEINDYVIILGGLVGEITNKYHNLSNSINENGIINLIDACDKYKNFKILFISTYSNYGITDNSELVNEDHELKPLSPYAKAEVKMKNTY